MSLIDALFYWLQMKLVCEARPDDEAARATVDFFAQILSEDHDLLSYDLTSQNEVKIYVTYTVKGESERTVWFDREAAEQLLHGPVLSKAEKDFDGNEEEQR
ncbi:hypothetical protein [Cohnella pontilimi]|uniref:hypothetical protein n=1 Tax=Cohnella pontilimi TaxID=2564100 RepID=UPI001B806EB9|nr:hypothetical protein [Cohnella pontilimi]